MYASAGGSAVNSHKVPEKESLRCWNVLVHKTSCEEKQKAWPWTRTNTFRMNDGAGCEPDLIPHISADALVSEWDQIPAGGSTCGGGKMAFSVSAAGVTLIHSVHLIFQHNHKNTRPCFWPVYSEPLVFTTPDWNRVWFWPHWEPDGSSWVRMKDARKGIKLQELFPQSSAGIPLRYRPSWRREPHQFVAFNHQHKHIFSWFIN